MSLLQIYRGLAAILVVLLHFTKNIYTSSGIIIFNNAFDTCGYYGVDFFFVLSGFIITYNHYSDIGYRQKVLPYFAKRLIRIYPIYWLLLAVYILIYLFMKREIFSQHDLSYFLKSFFLVYQPYDPVIIVSWTLCYEIFFYIVFGICLFLAKRIVKTVWVLWLLSIILINLFYQNPNTNIMQALVLNPCISEFLIGCFVGYFYLTSKKNHRITYFIVGMTLLLLTCYFNNIPLVIEKIAEGISFGFIVLGSTEFEYNYKFKPYLIRIGDSSYVIYLFHLIPVAILTRIIALLKSVSIGKSNNYQLLVEMSCMIGLVIIVYLSILIHTLIENPMTKRLRQVFLK